MNDAYLVPFLYTGGTLLVMISALWLVNIAFGFFDETTSLTREQAAKLALAAPYFAAHFFSYDTLQGKRPLARQWIRGLMYFDWDIKSRASALETLEWLAAAGSRATTGAENFGVRSSGATLTPSFFLAVPPLPGVPFPLPPSKPYRPGPQPPAPPQSPPPSRHVEFRALLAWDLMRLVFVARCCASVGLIEPGDLWRYADRAARNAEHHFDNWAEWSAAFLQGRRMWTRDVNAGYACVVKRLLASRTSVWNRVKWEEALGVAPAQSAQVDFRVAMA
ncbi:MAG: DUF1266 domain-containing protein [Betaproteobacteria bacterium]